MSIAVTAERPPIAADADGVLRVGGTRVTLDTIVQAFQDGLSAEGIAEQYPSLTLAHVYSAIGYYLAHRQTVDAYLRDRQAAAAQTREENERRSDPAGVRERLLARRPRG